MAVLDFLKKIFNKEEETDISSKSEITETFSLEIDEEDRVVVALAASIMAAEDKPNSRFHVSKITRIK